MNGRLTTLAVAAALLVLLLGPALAPGVTVTVAYTGDNVVAAFWHDHTSPQQIDISAIPFNDTWTVGKSFSLTLPFQPDTYELIFRVRNDVVGYDPGSGNPAGFLASVTGPITGGVMVTSSSWQYALDTDHGNAGLAPPTDGWLGATQWAYLQSNPQGGSSLNSGPNIWSQNGGPIAGISSNANWIWGDKNGEQLGPLGNPDPENWLWLKGTFTTVGAAQEAVPEPVSLIVWSVLGLGGGLGVMRRRRRMGWSDENRTAIHQLIARGRQ